MSEGQAGLVGNAQTNATVLRLLILEESASAAQTLIDPLRHAGYAVTAARVKSPLEFQLALRKQEWDLVLAPVQLPNFPAKQVAALLKHAKLDVPLIVMLDDCSDEVVTEALENGASTVVIRNNLTQLRYAVERELRDLTHRRARQYYERMFRESERRCHALLEASRDAIACVRTGKIIYSNPAFNALAGQAGDASAPELTDLVHPDERQTLIDVIKRIHQQIANKERMELRVQGSDGREFKTTVEVALAHVNGQPCAQITIALDAKTAPDIKATKRKSAAPVSGLISSAELMNELDGLLQSKKRSPLVVAHIELDQFDPLSHRIDIVEADQLSGDVTALIARVAGPEIKLSRHAGHVFIALLPAGTTDTAESICRGIAKQAWQHQGETVALTASVGACLPGDSITQAIAALAAADTACQLAKQAGGNRVQIASPHQQRAATQSDCALAARQRIRDALAGNRFRIVYQPIVSLHAQPFECYDVLTRMIDENGKEILPADFMPAAEQAGLMTALDRWVIRAALHILAQRRANQKETSFIIKLSGDSVSDPTLLPWLGNQLQELHVPGDTVIFEIKETCAMQDLAATQQLIQGLKQLGCRTTLGHFGTDPHSLDHLEKLRVDFVKLAASFVDKLSSEPRSDVSIKAVVQAAHDMGTLTIATFVQEASKMTALWQCHVDYIQGYFLQAPDQDLSYNFTEDA